MMQQRTILVFSDTSGTNLEPFQNRFETFRVTFDTIFQPFCFVLYSFGTVLVIFWFLVPFWYRSGTVWVPFRYSLGTDFGTGFNTGFGTVFVPFLYCF